MKIIFKENKELIKSSVIDVIQYKIPKQEEVQFNKISNRIDKHLAYAKSLFFMPSSIAKAIAYKKIEYQLFLEVLSIYFPNKEIENQFVKKLTIQMNAYYGQSILAKLTKVCSTANLLTCQLFIPKNPPAHLYASIYSIINHLNNGKKLASFDFKENKTYFDELYIRGDFYSNEL